jgi:hypothetical protein
MESGRRISIDGVHRYSAPSSSFSSFFSTFTTFGTSRDVTIDELRIESMFPADEVTAELCRMLAAHRS